MRRLLLGTAVVAAMVISVGVLARATDDDDIRDSRVRQGFAISPVPLHLKGLNRARVGLGSYLVNAVGSCSDCHSCPSYTPGHNPYDGVGDGKINSDNFLAGGVPFGPFLQSANLTPNASGVPEQGNSFEVFRTLIRTGHDPDEPGHILQVMPWPILRNMTDHDLRAIYEYLKAIPTAQPGTCAGPGQ